MFYGFGSIRLVGGGVGGVDLKFGVKIKRTSAKCFKFLFKYLFMAFLTKINIISIILVTPVEHCTRLSYTQYTFVLIDLIASNK